MPESDLTFKAIVILSSILGLSYKIYKDRVSLRTIKLNSIKSFLERRDEIRKEKKYVQDLEVNSVSYFKGFNWIQLDILLNKNIDLITLNNLRHLSKKDFLIVYENKVVIPNRSYICKKYRLQPMSYILPIGWIASTFLLGIFILDGKFDLYKISIEGVLFLLFEIVTLYHFNSLITLKAIEKSGVTPFEVYISDNFDIDLETYENFKREYYKKIFIDNILDHDEDKRSE